jgi:CheY-like chemotaxis protein
LQPTLINARYCAALPTFNARGCSVHTVIEARNGKEGLQLFKPADIDLVITDIIMPEMEGLEVLRKLRTRQMPPVKIIAISGGGKQSAADNLKMAKFLGAAKVLAKPFSNEVLISAINELLPGVSK